MTRLIQIKKGNVRLVAMVFRWGMECGRPGAEDIGTPPEWFQRGTGGTLPAQGEPLDIAGYADDGGEEAEIAGAYIIARDGRPYRIGMAVGNEFSDHEFEKKSYLYLAGAKLHFKLEAERRPGDVHVHFLAQTA